jgi:hypothetical protein
MKKIGKEDFEALSEIFTKANKKIADCFFSFELEAVQTVIVPRLDNKDPYACIMGASNDICQALFVVGTTTPSLFPVPEQENQDTSVLCMDALGEYLNNLCAELCSTEQFIAQFGILVQAPPIITTGGQHFFPLAWGIQDSYAMRGFAFSVAFAARLVA